MSEARGEDRFRALAAYGSDFAKWPPQHRTGAREALLGDPVFRRAWDRERGLDRAMAEARGDLDRQIGSSGAAERVRRRILAQLPVAAFSGWDWQRIAAAMVVAGMLGGAMDLALTPPVPETPDLVMLDPLYPLDDTAPQ